jgi:hypothetical protein
MGIWEHINFTASEDDKSLKYFFAELSHGEAHWGRNHKTEAEKVTACCLLEEGELCISFVPSYARSGMFVNFYAAIVFYHFTLCILYYCFWFVYLFITFFIIIIIGSTKDYCGFCPHENKIYHPLQGSTAGIHW